MSARAKMSAVLRLALGVALLAVGGGCAGFDAMLARPADLTDYRAFRVSAAEGTRLARAQRYLERHPRGRFEAEVRAAFDEEEPRYFETSQASRQGIRRYLADLPEGPHASAALAMLIAFNSNMQEAELLDIARRVRNEDAKLETRAVQRRALGEAILGAVGALLDEGVYGLPRAGGTAALRSFLLGPAGSTWGAVPQRREEDLFFMLPTRPERESRLLTLEMSVVEKGGVVVQGMLEGGDMFVRWAEADQIVKLDPSEMDDRTEAHVHAMDRLSGALERRFPQSMCADLRRGRELYHRACDGWEVVVTAGDRAGDKDSIVVRGPAKTGGAR